MSFTLNQLLALMDPRQRELIVGVEDPADLADSLPITGAKALNLATESELVFCKSDRAELLAALTASPSRVVVTLPEIAPLLGDAWKSTRILVLTPRPRLLVALLMAPYCGPSSLCSQCTPIHPDAQVDPTARLGPGVVLGADVQIGPGCAIGASTVIDHATIGANTWIGNNCSIGGDGFGYEIDRELGIVVKVPHFGRVIIGQECEISSNNTIDRGSMRDTVLGDQVKTDNLVHIAHNCVLKRGALLMANVMVAGSTTIGEDTWVAPSTSLTNGMTMGDLSMTGVGTVAVKDIPKNTVVVGVPARAIRKRFDEDAS